MIFDRKPVPKPHPSHIKSEVNCRALSTILIFVETTYGEQGLRALVEKTGMPLEHLRDENNWVSWSYYCSLLEALAEWTGDPRAPFRAGTFSGHRRSWGSLYYIFYAFGQVGLILKKAVEIVPRFNKTAEWTLLSLQSNRCTFRVRMKPGYPAHRFCCEARMGQAAGISRAFGMPLGRARELQCQALGADACVCEVTWLNRPRKLFSIMGLLVALPLMGLLYPSLPGGVPSAAAAAGILLLGYLIGRVFDARAAEAGNARINSEQTDALEESLQVIEDKYRALREAHDELTVVYEITQRIQGTPRLDVLLDDLLRLIVERLGFDRCLVFLNDADRGSLRDARVHGDKSLRSHVSKLVIPLDGNSILAQPVLEEYQVRLVRTDGLPAGRVSELERRIYEITGTREYVLAPIVWKGDLLGILAADNIRSGAPVSEARRRLLENLVGQVAAGMASARAFGVIEKLNVKLERTVAARTLELQEANMELLLSNERLKELNRAKSEFIDIAVHDLRTPLTAIVSYADLLRRYSDEPYETRREFVDIILQESRRMNALINDYLDLSKLEAGFVDFRTDEIDVRAVVGDVLRSCDMKLREKRIHVTEQLSPALPILNMDMGRIKQVFSNLIDNAIKYTPSGGSISIEGELLHETGLIQFVVQDSGVGIDAKDQETLFAKFGRIMDATVRKNQGTGLGLSIVKTIVEHYGGRIWVESEKGRGSRFIFTLPMGLSGCPSRHVVALQSNSREFIRQIVPLCRTYLKRHFACVFFGGGEAFEGLRRALLAQGMDVEHLMQREQLMFELGPLGAASDQGDPDQNFCDRAAAVLDRMERTSWSGFIVVCDVAQQFAESHRLQQLVSFEAWINDFLGHAGKPIIHVCRHAPGTFSESDMAGLTGLHPYALTEGKIVPRVPWVPVPPRASA